MAKLIKKAESPSDLETLQPEPILVEVNGEKIPVNEFTWGKLLKALKFIGNIMDVLAVGLDTDIENMDVKFIQAITEHGDDVLGLMMLATDKPASFFDSLSAQKGLEFAIATFEANKPFFVQHLIPKLSQINQSTSTEDQEKNSL